MSGKRCWMVLSVLLVACGGEAVDSASGSDELKEESDSTVEGTAGSTADSDSSAAGTAASSGGRGASTPGGTGDGPVPDADEGSNAAGAGSSTGGSDADGRGTSTGGTSTAGASTAGASTGGGTDDGDTEPDEPQPDADGNAGGGSSGVNDPCAGRSCGDACDACPPAPDTQCIFGAGFCNADGRCMPNEPTCESPSEPEVEQPGGDEPDGEDCACPVPAICKFCDDDLETCARPIPHCTADGECLDVTWECPDGTPLPAECEKDSDCGIVAVCTTCDNGQDWCPQAACVDGACGSSPNLCPEAYDPCAGKTDGDYCQLCSPLDPDCVEDASIKICGSGVCR